MTPTEQVNELRELLEKYADTIETDDGEYLAVDIDHIVEPILQLIAADRKRVALEARIGALDIIHKRLAGSDLNTKHYKIISKMLIESKEGYREAMKQ